MIVLPAQPHRREPCDLYARGPISKAAGSPRDGSGLGGNAHLGTIGDGEGKRQYCGGKSDVQDERQSSSSEVIGRTSDSVQCSTARRDGEQSNQAPAQPGAGASPCCEAASWVQGSLALAPWPSRCLRGRPRSLSCFTWAVVRRAATVEAQRQNERHGAWPRNGKGRRMHAATP